MTIPKLTPYTGQVANPDGSQTQTEFTQNMFDQLSYEAQLATELDATIDGVNQAVTDVENNTAAASASAAAAEASASIAGYQGLWPDTGGSALKGETYQTQVGGVPTGEYYTALQDTSIDPVGDNINWKRDGDINRDNLSDYTDLVYKASDGNSAVDNMAAGNPIANAVGDILKTGSTVWTKESDTTPITDQNYRAFNAVAVSDFRADTHEDDTIAFQKVAAHIEAKGGGDIYLGNRVFRVGTQTIKSGSGFYADWDPVVKITGCARPIVIHGGGAVIKVNDNLLYGAFDPNTGLPITLDSGDIADPKYAARAYIVFDMQDNESVTYKDFSIDGNLENLTLGGNWGTTSGYQLQGYGIFNKGNKSTTLIDIKTDGCALDGIYHGKSTANQGDVVIKHYAVTSSRSGRNNLTIAGCSSFDDFGGVYKDQGKIVNGATTVSTAPASGCDIEAETGAIRNVNFWGTSLFNNTNTQLVADSGDTKNVTLNSVFIYAPSGVALWPNKPSFVINNSILIGKIQQTAEGTVFNETLITDSYDGKEIDASERGGNLIDTNTREVFFKGVTFSSRYSNVNARGGSVFSDGCKYIARQGTDYFSDLAFIAQFDNSFGEIDFVQIYEGGNPATGYSINNQGAQIKGVIDYEGNPILLRWGNASTGVDGEIDQTLQRLKFNRRLVSSGGFGFGYLGNNNSVPTSLEWSTGDFVFKANPTTGVEVGWGCSVGGTGGATAVFVTAPDYV